MIVSKYRVFLLSLVVVLMFFRSITFAVQFVELDADGEVKINENCITHRVIKKLSILTGNVQSGFLHKGKFFFFDGLFLKYLTLNDGKDFEIVNFEALLPNSFPWYIAGIEGDNIIFSVYRSSISTINEKLDVSIYEYDFEENILKNISIKGGISSPYFTILDRKIFYTDKDGKVGEYGLGNKKSHEITGSIPTISPKGDMLAFVKRGMLELVPKNRTVV